MRRGLLLAALLLLAFAVPVADARTVRAFAVGPKFELSWVESRQTYRDKLFALTDARLRGDGAPAIQRGADDVVSHLRGPDDPARPVETARDLVTLPEDIGLFAIFTGTQGAVARGAPDLTSAIGAVLAGYAPQSAYYATRFPALAARGIPTRLLFAAATDTFVRVAVETFAELADRTDAYLVAGVNMARDWKVVCADEDLMPELPGGVRCEEEDPAKVALLRSPDEPSRTYAYEATTPKASNMALVFAPDGRLISRQVKTYLTPPELPGQLDLVPGDVSGGLSAVETPVGTLGIVVSKDAWMPDVTAKLDARHVDLLVQPEFFVNSTVSTTGPWQPDNITGSGYADVLRHPSMEAMVLPEVTGNVFDFSADNQQAIVTKPRSSRERPGLVGQPAAPGWRAVQEWVVPDPLAPGEPIPERRRRLGEAGEQLLPRDSSPPCPDPREPGPCRGGQVEGVLWADVEVDRDPPLRRTRPRPAGRTRFSQARPLAPSRRPQRHLDLAARGRTVLAAFEEERGARDVVRVARSRDGGRRWERPVTLRRDGDAWWPSVALGPRGEAWLAWQDDATGVHRAYLARSVDGGRTWSEPFPVDGRPHPSVHQWRPVVAATGPGRAFVAWIDERERFAGEEAQPQAALYGARVEGERVHQGRRLDAPGPSDPLAATLDNAWAPEVAARGDELLVTWVDFAGYEWDALARRSTDGGATFAPQERLNATPAEQEAISDAPAAALTATGPLVAFTDWDLGEETQRRPHSLYDTVVARPGARPRQVDGHGAAFTATFAPAIAALPSGGALVAWQDHARGHADVRAARLDADGHPGRTFRVDDAGRRGWNAWRPALAISRGRAVAVWEDERDGPPQVYVARASVGRLPR